MDIRYIDYDRNTKHVGGAEILVVKIYGYVCLLVLCVGGEE